MIRFQSSIPETLQLLQQQGYVLADQDIAALRDQELHSDDWRLDALQKVDHHFHQDMAVVVVAVSSRKKGLKLLFVEVVTPECDFTPMLLMRRLFPMRQRA